MFAYISNFGDYIPEGELPERPDEKHVVSNEEYLKDKPKAKTVVQQVLENLANKKDDKIEVIDFSKIKSVSKGGHV
jgi:hypothetical protein